MLSKRVVSSAGAGIFLLVSAVAFAQQNRPATQTNPKPKEVTSIADPRTPIMLSDDEINFIRREMRGLLESVREILDATSSNDPQRIIAAGRRAGMNGPEATHIPQTLAPRLPMEFKKLGLATHRAFDQIAFDAEKIGATDRAYRQLADVMNNCTACHGTWRITGDTRR
jgi:hypothetical protein